ncbi:MAG: tRNA (adenosine(37)-N6)-threonylcarbamoyltransferase complex dimerization subunit type 1 TsaB [Terriglobales bacterium]
MWTLALETTTQQGSLALLREEACVECAPLAGRAYAATLIPGIESLLAAHAVTLQQVNLLAVANGPGSFTGTRIGLATVKALMETLGTPAIAVGTLEAVAAGVDECKRQPGEVLAVLDAGRGSVYVGIYPEGREFEETATAFATRLQEWAGAAATPDVTLAGRWPQLHLAGPLLAPLTGALALRAWQQVGRGADALTLDARYLGARWGGSPLAAMGLAKLP